MGHTRTAVEDSVASTGGALKAHLLELACSHLCGVVLLSLWALAVEVRLWGRVVATHIRGVAAAHLVVALKGALIVVIGLHVVGVTCGWNSGSRVHSALPRIGRGLILGLSPEL